MPNVKFSCRSFWKTHYIHYQTYINVIQNKQNAHMCSITSLFLHSKKKMACFILLIVWHLYLGLVTGSFVDILILHLSLTHITYSCCISGSLLRVLLGMLSVAVTLKTKNIQNFTVVLTKINTNIIISILN